MAWTIPRVKICCISSLEEARLAIDHGAAALGLVSAMPSGPGVIEEQLIREIAELMPPGVATFLLTSKQDVQGIIEQHHYCRTNTIQLCDRLTNGTYQDLHQALPGIKIVQVVHVTGEESIAEALEISPQVDAILLDSGNQSLPTKELGGTGRTHDWSISQQIREAISIPLFLAGGLNPRNVQQAIAQVQSFGLDLCSSVRTDGKLDPAKLSQFMQQVHSLDDPHKK